MTASSLSPAAEYQVQDLIRRHGSEIKTIAVAESWLQEYKQHGSSIHEGNIEDATARVAQLLHLAH